MWQHVNLSEQICPWHTLACCWDVKQPTHVAGTLSNQPTTTPRWPSGRTSSQRAGDTGIGPRFPCCVTQVTCIPNFASATQSSALAVLAVRQNHCYSPAPSTSHSEKGIWDRYHGDRRQFSQSNRHSTIGTRQTEHHEALPSSANVQSHLTSSFADGGNSSWYSVCHVPMVEWRLDCENCRHLTVVGLLDTGPWPDHTPVALKPYGSLGELRCTATCIEETWVSIWRTRRRRHQWLYSRYSSGSPARRPALLGQC